MPKGRRLKIDNIQTCCDCVSTEAIASKGCKEDKNDRDGMPCVEIKDVNRLRVLSHAYYLRE